MYPLCVPCRSARRPIGQQYDPAHSGCEDVDGITSYKAAVWEEKPKVQGRKRSHLKYRPLLSPHNSKLSQWSPLHPRNRLRKSWFSLVEQQVKRRGRRTALDSILHKEVAMGRKATSALSSQLWAISPWAAGNLWGRCCAHRRGEWRANADAVSCGGMKCSGMRRGGGCTALWTYQKNTELCALKGWTIR